ncbi:MAG TPA: hypothetical protein VGK19_05215 [Capsulimonadaceae bacterium]
MNKLAASLSLTALAFAASRINAILKHRAAIAASRASRQADLWRGDGSMDFADDSPLVQITFIIIGKAMAEDASEIYLVPDKTHIRVDYKIHGERCEVMKIPKHYQRPIEFCFRAAAAVSTDINPLGGDLSVVRRGVRQRFHLRRVVGSDGSELTFTRYE